MRCYLDTSALLKLVILEPESEWIAEFVEGQLQLGSEFLVSQWAHTEASCVLDRRLPTHKSLLTLVMASFAIHPVPSSAFDLAARAGWKLRSGDALHLAIALTLSADSLLSFDQELLAAAQEQGLHTRPQ